MPPKGVVKRGNNAVRSYYEDVKRAGESRAGVIYRQRLKVVMLGSSSADNHRRGADSSDTTPEEHNTIH